MLRVMRAKLKSFISRCYMTTEQFCHLIVEITLARGIVEAHAGTITVEHSELEGTAFIMMPAESIQSEIDHLRSETTLSEILVKPLSMSLVSRSLNALFSFVPKFALGCGLFFGRLNIDLLFDRPRCAARSPKNHKNSG
jgi:hypothetical protein